LGLVGVIVWVSFGKRHGWKVLTIDEVDGVGVDYSRVIVLTLDFEIVRNQADWSFGHWVVGLEWLLTKSTTATATTAAATTWGSSVLRGSSVVVWSLLALSLVAATAVVLALVAAATVVLALVAAATAVVLLLATLVAAAALRSILLSLVIIVRLVAHFEICLLLFYVSDV